MNKKTINKHVANKPKAFVGALVSTGIGVVGSLIAKEAARKAAIAGERRSFDAQNNAEIANDEILASQYKTQGTDIKSYFKDGGKMGTNARITPNMANPTSEQYKSFGSKEKYKEVMDARGTTPTYDKDTIDKENLKRMRANPNTVIKAKDMIKKSITPIFEIGGKFHRPKHRTYKSVYGSNNSGAGFQLEGEYGNKTTGNSLNLEGSIPIYDGGNNGDAAYYNPKIKIGNKSSSATMGLKHVVQGENARFETNPYLGVSSDGKKAKPVYGLRFDGRLHTRNGSGVGIEGSVGSDMPKSELFDIPMDAKATAKINMGKGWSVNGKSSFDGRRGSVGIAKTFRKGGKINKHIC